MNDAHTIILLIKKIRKILLPVGIISILTISYAVTTRTTLPTKAESSGVAINFTSITTPLSDSETWRWRTDVSASQHQGETITIQYGVYWCGSSSGQKGEGVGSPCAADLSPGDFKGTLIFENRQLLVQKTSFESTHRGVSCGRVQIDIGGLGGILGGDTYDTGVACGGAQQPTSPPTNPTEAPPAPTYSTSAEQQALIAIAASLLEDVVQQHFPPDSSDGENGQNVPPSSPPPPPTNGYQLDYDIPIRDVSIKPKSGAREKVASTWPHAKMEYWDLIISKSVENGWNPSFALTLWIEETGGSTTTLRENGGSGVCRGACSRGHLGCAPRQDQTITESLSCLYKNFSQFNSNQFPEFMARYSGERAVGIFERNPNFPKNVKIWYNNLTQ